LKLKKIKMSDEDEIGSELSGMEDYPESFSVGTSPASSFDEISLLQIPREPERFFDEDEIMEYEESGMANDERRDEDSDPVGEYLRFERLGMGYTPILRNIYCDDLNTVEMTKRRVSKQGPKIEEVADSKESKKVEKKVPYKVEKKDEKMNFGNIKSVENAKNEEKKNEKKEEKKEDEKKEEKKEEEKKEEKKNEKKDDKKEEKKKKKKEKKQVMWVVTKAKSSFKKPKGDLVKEEDIMNVMKDLVEKGIRFSVQKTERITKPRKTNQWSVYMAEKLNAYKLEKGIKSLKATERNELMRAFAKEWKEEKKEKKE
jgi:hypothetical protein